jgi:hypothetical protein
VDDYPYRPEQEAEYRFYAAVVAIEELWKYLMKFPFYIKQWRIKKETGKGMPPYHIRFW